MGFVLGDEVRITDIRATSHDFKIGQVVEIIRVWDGIHKGYYRARGRDGKTCDVYKTEIKELSIDNTKN